MSPKKLNKKTKEEQQIEDDNIILAKQLQDNLSDNEDYYVSPKAFSLELMEYYKTGNMTDKLVTMASNIAIRLAYRPNFMNYCVDDKTEALTNRGWMKYNEMKLSDKILSYNIKSNHLIWSNIKDLYINNNYNDKMHYITNYGLDALVTPHHNFVVKNEGLIEIEDIKAKKHIIIMGKPVKEQLIDKKYTNDFIEIVGWAVTEGHYTLGKKTHSITIFQKNNEKANQIRNCLNRLNVPYKEYVCIKKTDILGFRINKKIANDIINLAPNKILSMDFILSLNNEQRLLLIDTMIKGDGWTTNSLSKQGYSYGYTQKDKRHIDNFIALCTLSGITTSTSYVENETPFGLSKYYSVYFYTKPKYSCATDNIDFHGGKRPAGGDVRHNKKYNIPTIDYNGTVWCPQTEYGTFICRRGKYVFITGNTYKDEMIGDATIKIMSALVHKKFNPIKAKGNPFSYFTKIAVNSFRNRIKKEKKAHEALRAYQEETYGRIMSETLPHRQLPYHNNSDLLNYESQ